MANDGYVRTYWRMLVESLRLLAANPQIQIGCFPEFVCIPDEIVAAFGDVYDFYFERMVAEGAFTEGQEAEVRKLKAVLHEMSDNKLIWSLECVRHAAEWENLRNKASAVLEVLQEEKKAPHIFWMQFVPTDRPEPKE